MGTWIDLCLTQPMLDWKVTNQRLKAKKDTCEGVFSRLFYVQGKLFRVCLIVFFDNQIVTKSSV